MIDELILVVPDERAQDGGALEADGYRVPSLASTVVRYPFFQNMDGAAKMGGGGWA